MGLVLWGLRPGSTWLWEPGEEVAPAWLLGGSRRKGEKAHIATEGPPGKPAASLPPRGSPAPTSTWEPGLHTQAFGDRPTWKVGAH